jgi:hypothetical protein
MVIQTQCFLGTKVQTQHQQNVVQAKHTCDIAGSPSTSPAELMFEDPLQMMGLFGASGVKAKGPSLRLVAA